jgi:hypothetical protein
VFVPKAMMDKHVNPIATQPLEWKNALMWKVATNLKSNATSNVPVSGDFHSLRVCLVVSI